MLNVFIDQFAKKNQGRYLLLIIISHFVFFYSENKIQVEVQEHWFEYIV